MKEKVCVCVYVCCEMDCGSTQRLDKYMIYGRSKLTEMIPPRWCSSVSGPVDVITPFDVVATAANVELADDTDIVVDSFVVAVDERSRNSVKWAINIMEAVEILKKWTKRRIFKGIFGNR